MRDNKFDEFVALLGQATVFDPHENDWGNKNLLHWAADEKRSRFIEFLLFMGLDARKRDIHGHSVIWHLTSSGCWTHDPTDFIPSVALLVGAGAVFECASADRNFFPSYVLAGDKAKIATEIFSMLQKSKLA